MSPQKYAHLGAAESALWDLFLAKYGGSWSSYKYDVRVGQGRPVPEELPHYVRDALRQLTPLRIDVVGYRGAEPTIFEIRAKLGRAQIGACHIYQGLYVEMFPTEPSPVCAIVGQRIHPDIERVALAQGIAVYLFPDFKEPPRPASAS